MSEIVNIEEKRAKLIELVREAVNERTHSPRSEMRTQEAPIFDPAGRFQTHWIDALVNALKTTDALEVLWREINE